jgi:hypothetical protein
LGKIAENCDHNIDPWGPMLGILKKIGENIGVFDQKIHLITYAEIVIVTLVFKKIAMFRQND